MIILDTNEYKNVKINLNGTRCPTFVYSILDGYIPGKVYADSHLHQTVLFERTIGIYSIVGATENVEFNNFLFNLYRRRKEEGLRFTLFSSSEIWDSVIMGEFEKEIRHLVRFSFNYDANKEVANVIKLPINYSLKKINSAVIENSQEFDKNYYEAYWGSIGNYEEKGFGYAILHDAKVISECTSIFASEQFAEIDIATHNDYRGQGLAKIIAKIFINHSLKNNIIPRWDCDISNTTSIKLAKKLGFTNPIKYSIFT